MPIIRQLRPQTIFESFDTPDITNYSMGGGIMSSPDQFADIDPEFQRPLPPQQEQPVPMPGPMIPSVSQPGEVTPSFQEWSENVRGAQNLQTGATDRFNRFLDDAPELNSPSIGRTIAAGMAGFRKDPKVAQEILYAPAMRDMALWKEKATPFYNAANLENQANNIDRQMVGQMATGYLGERRAAETERKNRETFEVQKIRAEAYDFKQRHPDWKFNFDGPNIVAVSPDGRQSVNLGPTGKMSEADRINLQTQGRIQVAQTTGEQNQETQRIRNQGTANVATIREGGGDGSGSGNTIESERQRNIRMRNAFEVDPNASKFIKQISAGKFELVPRPVPTPGTLWGWKVDPKEAAEWDQLKKRIDPDYVIPASGTPTETDEPPATPVKQSSTQGIGPSAVPKVDKAKQLAAELLNPNLSGRQRQALQTQLDQHILTTEYNKKREQEILGELKQNRTLSGRQKQALEAELVRIQAAKGGSDVDSALRQRATDHLTRAGLPVTEANIKHAIQVGDVQ